MKSRAVIVLVFFFVSCQSGNKNTFDLLEASETSILFSNDLQHSEQFNTYTYRNFYNGAGVATGDINNDGLIDLYFTGNQVDNRLYLNKGNFQFKDITEQAGVSCPGVWSTGVSMADVNGDGWLDIYVCKSGPQEGSNRFNELFINNGDLTFTEKSSEYRLNDIGLSNHAVFFDYDRDNDLDFYLLNNSGRSVGIYDLWEGQREVRDTLGGNKLYRNDGQYFTDVSEEAGIYGSSIGFGLGVTASDINGDGWPDLFVSNDFFERDYLYINQMDGSFKESMTAVMTETSLGSMGADIADINNDLKPDIFVSEMLPESWERAKSKSTFEDWDKHQANIKNGFHRQYSRNVLQLNRGRQSGDAKPYFSDISRLTNLHATDWSWGALIFDYDNDGNKDVYVANGIVKDLIDQDYINFRANSSLEFSKYKKDSLLLTKLIESIPSQPIPNYLFKNEGKLSFTNVTDDI
ncbi:MAG: VCBS repeat-containing protein [Bacteroidota bacterium]